MKERLPVILNIYNIKEDTILDLIGIQIYHTAIEFDDVEYAFGYHTEFTSGIYDIKPMSYDNGTFIESVLLGYIDRKTFFNTLEKLKKTFTGKSYNILFKNCNHFTNKFTKSLFNTEIPKKYSKFLSIGETLRNIF